MGREKTVIESPVALEDVILVPITRESVNYRRLNDGCSFFVTKRPIAVVVVSGSVKTVFRISGEKISLKQLVREFPDIRDSLKEAISGLK